MQQNRIFSLMLRIITMLIQWTLAIVFLFSGFVKALDPMGMEHKLEAYCASMGWNIMSGSIYLDVATISLALIEFSLGIYLLLGMRKRLAGYGSLIFMAIMTLITLYIYMYSPVPDCGCFGAAITLTNGETLAKNIILLSFCILFLLLHRHSLRIISIYNQWQLSTYSLIYMLGVALYSLHFLPLIDFTGYTLGTNIPEAMRGEYHTTFVYEKNGEKKKFTTETLPDSTWKYLDAQTEIISSPKIADFSILGDQGEEISEELLSDTGFVFVVVSPHLQTADLGCADALNDIYDFATDHHARMICLTPSDSAVISQWKDKTGAPYTFAWSSSEMLKAMVRANPGLILLKKGTILAKWSENDMPTEQELQDFSFLDDTQKYEQRSGLKKLLLWFSIPFLILFLLDRIWIGKRYFKIYQHYKTFKRTHHEKTHCSR